jgi:hypothetical protein
VLPASYHIINLLDRRKVIYDILSIGASVAVSIYPDAVRTLDTNKHESADKMQQLGYQGNLKLQRAKKMFKQMQELGLVVGDGDIDILEDIILNDIYVQKAWNEMYYYLSR